MLAAIDFPTLIVLFDLMVLPAQFAACGFYDWCSARIAATHASPVAILGLTVAVAGVLSAVLANDIVVFAMTPVLIKGLSERGLDPRPYLIALASAANAGSTATVIGNPQNILIGQVGRLDFWGFVVACGPPALLALLTVFSVLWISPSGLPAMALLTLVGSNTIGNVPTVVLLVAILKDLPTEVLYAMAALSKLARNLLVVGSLANIIVVERAKEAGVALGFLEHARCGIPIAVISFALRLPGLSAGRSRGA